MNLQKLMAGIAVVIDDQLDTTNDQMDPINKIVDWFEENWHLSFVKSKTLPDETCWPNLLHAASFVLLDWRLWGNGGDELKRRTIEEICEFLKCARNSLVPVFIFTNEAVEDVISKLPSSIYNSNDTSRNYVFVESKNKFWSGETVKLKRLDKWAHENASVYTLLSWEKVLNEAKKELFSRMLDKSVDWPRVFWRSYVEDSADPSSSLTSLINESLTGRMRLDGFDSKYLGGEHEDVSDNVLRGLIAETSFRQNNVLPGNAIGCGDLYKQSGKYLLNLRPDCDCIPRDGDVVDDVDVYCVTGRKLGPSQLSRLFKNGHFEERISQSVIFAIVDGETSIQFNFKKLVVKKYSEVKARRVGRLLHPYITRVQQRYALYIQRQALPRIPNDAVPRVATDSQ